MIMDDAAGRGWRTFESSACARRVLNFDFQAAVVSEILFFVCAATGIFICGQCPAAWAEI